MNKVEVRSLIELLPVMQAFLDGKPIQVARRPSDIDPYFEPKWETYTGDCPDFNSGYFIWRIKPEPREFWMVTYKHGLNPTIHGVEEHALIAFKNSDHGVEIIHVREAV